MQRPAHASHSHSDAASDSDDGYHASDRALLAVTAEPPPPTTTTTTSSTPSSSPHTSYTRSSPNVTAVLWYTFLDGACYSLWGMQLLPLYLQKITSHTSAIGAAATTGGVAQLAGAVTAGYVSDHFSRQLCIRAGALCAVAALLMLLCAVSLSRAPLVFVGQGLWGLYTGITSTSVEALFADSVPQGRRTKIYNAKWMLQTVCYVVGYLGAAVFFALWQNTWELTKTRVVLVLGVALHPIALVPLWWLSDRQSLPNTAEEVEEGESSTTTTATSVPATALAVSDAAPVPSQEGTPPPPPSKVAVEAANSQAQQRQQQRGVVTSVRDSEESAAAQTQAAVSSPSFSLTLPRRRSTTELLRQPPTPSISSYDTDDRQDDTVSCVRWCMRRACSRSGGLASSATVHYWICAVDFLLAMGSGMSLPFFSPYLATERHVSPAGLYAIFTASTLLTAATSSLLPWLIARTNAGRIPTVIGVRVVGTSALLLLATAHDDEALHALPATVALFLCRNALMNSVFGVTRSVIMDCVDRHTRGRWSAFESVTSLSWAGSAALGGLITEARGYAMNFKITAVVQLAATLLMLPAAVGAWELDHPLSTTTRAAAAATEEEERAVAAGAAAAAA